jgi:arylsulfatase A
MASSSFVRCGAIWLPVLTGLLWLTGCAPSTDTDRPPNLVIIFADDLGYGDLGVYGHPTIRTPRLDRMAAEGMKFTQFYTGASVCTPSRAALLTGRLPVRSGMASDTRRVLFPDSRLGLPAEEITIAEALKEQGYATAAIGKWHLGHLPPYLPTRNGFDTYFGIPYSNDMDRTVGGEWQEIFWEPRIESWNVPLMRDEDIVERPADQRTITKRYTEEAVQFIRAHRDEPFFVYLAHSMPHVPLFRSDAFADVSRRGRYGDVVEEIDWSVGQILDALRAEGLAENTLVFFTSDNGPWLVFDTHGGSAGLLYGGKGMTWEGGMRVPGLAWWPGTVAPGSVNNAVTSTMDLFATALSMAGRALPDDRVIDGRDLLPVLTGTSTEAVRDVYFYYRGTTLYAVRKGPWKAHFITQWAYVADSVRVAHDTPRLFNLDHDPSEQYDVAAAHPDVIADIRAEVERHQANLDARPTQLDARIGDP